MQFRNLAARFALGLVLLSGALACRITDEFIASSAPTPTRTRTPRPTFTPIPLPTETFTPVPTVPPPPTSAPVPTRTPTRRPATAVPRPPTAVPVVVQPTAVPGPTSSPYQWHANPPGCEHAGGVFVKARVYGDKNNPDSGMEGVKVVLGGKDGGRFDIPPVTTSWDGTYSFTLSADGAPPFKGTVYVWLIDGSGNRMSDIGGPINFNGLGPDNGGCWHGWVDFWR
ncbi:MAG: hypothetical protein HZB51_01675 [Chloroflexi bacterium]|nr:hypothetical protein [Chloroflexota bacterium]